MSIGSIGSNVATQPQNALATPSRSTASTNVPKIAAKGVASSSEEATEPAAEAKMEAARGAEEGAKLAKNVPPGVGQKLNVVG